MKIKDRVSAAAILLFLFLTVIEGMYIVHFQGRSAAADRDDSDVGLWFNSDDETSGKEDADSTDAAQGDTIRVVISTSDFSDLFHEDVLLTAAYDYTLEWESESKTIAAGTQWSAAAFFNENPQVNICRLSVSEGGISLLSITRGYGTPVYEGYLEIRNTSSGYVIVNELSAETYLRYVVPSEMPETYGQEALKAQAICARNYAWQHIQTPAYPEYDAALDDSVRFQVFNNSLTNAEADSAIEATEGQLLTYEGTVINAYYYSTSWGYTTDLTLWGSSVLPYYVSQWMGAGQLAPELTNADLTAADLTDEEVFRMILSEEYSAYESDEPWYRWSTTISVERILENLGNIEGAELDSLTQIQITKRRTGGSVSEMVLTGDGRKVTLVKESEIRGVLIPSQEQVFRNDGSVIEGYEKLPSSFFTIDQNTEDGKLVSVTVRGGGCGHGVGMSQNCAKVLAAQGKTCQEILEFFYPGTEVIFFP